MIANATNHDLARQFALFQQMLRDRHATLRIYLDELGQWKEPLIELERTTFWQEPRPFPFGYELELPFGVYPERGSRKPEGDIESAPVALCVQSIPKLGRDSEAVLFIDGVFGRACENHGIWSRALANHFPPLRGHYAHNAPSIARGK